LAAAVRFGIAPAFAFAADFDALADFDFAAAVFFAFPPAFGLPSAVAFATAAAVVAGAPSASLARCPRFALRRTGRERGRLVMTSRFESSSWATMRMMPRGLCHPGSSHETNGARGRNSF
jgi:hypothetical protein